MFDDFDLRKNVEEFLNYDAEVAFESWYGEDFSDYCDDIQKRAGSSFFRKEQDYFDVF